MIRFDSDYLEGAHPRVLRALADTNAVQTPGYGEDEYCERARELIRSLCGTPEAAVHFLVGGTQANRTVIVSALRPHQGAVAADSGHIAVHETGAIESAGHKVLTLPGVDGKLSAAAVDALCRDHFANEAFEHMVQPGMVYISQPTEIGTVYTHRELEELYAVCQKWSLPLYIDGARLGCALVSEESWTLSELAALCDVFTIGGTKLGALFGEAVVITSPALQQDFRYLIKQNGGMLAKGRLLGVQFLALLEDGLYEEIARHEVELAMELRDGLREKGWDFLVESPTNQQFPILPDSAVEALREDFSFSVWQKMGEDSTAVRFCTSWATSPEQIEALLCAVPAREEA
ncbi:MAG: low specificity L-threonine aldolase [Oscillospiraceae bacterium]|nr:low specificity L-threonine aldolase [Oscillospiraceae bacterium]